jgi:acyl-CoA thioesterase
MRPIEELTALLNKDKFAAYNNIRFVSMENGVATVAADINDNHLNGLGIPQGGMIFTLADFVLAVLANAEADAKTVTLDASINFIKASRGKTLTARGRYVSRGRTICIANVEVTDDLGVLCAVATFTGFTRQ